MKKFLLSAFVCLTFISASAQSPTTSTNVTGCSVFRNFNTSNEGFSSPSIYSDANDVSYFWNSTLGAEIENSGLNGRTGSLISPVYTLAETGQTTIGFKYEAPAGTEYRIRIITAASNPPLEILATTANGSIFTALPNTSGNLCVRLTDQDLVAGQQIRFEFTFRVMKGHSDERVLFDDLSIAVAGGALPVTFEGFVARRMDDGTTKLLWNVGHEVNVKGYYVETSSNGINFKNIGYVNATGKTVYSLNYLDKISGTMYFRIKNVDFDGKAKYSAIIKLYNKETVLDNLQVYPQPAFEQVTVQHNKATEKAVFTLYRADGKIILQKMAMPSTQQTQLNISNLNSGLYMLRYDDGTGKVQTKSLIKN
jgi:hypothetical protein